MNRRVPELVAVADVAFDTGSFATARRGVGQQEVIEASSFIVLGPC
jgi:hypothetical protein